MKYGDDYDIAYFYGTYITDQEVLSAKWFAQNTVEDSMVYVDSLQPQSEHPLISYGMVDFTRMYDLNVSLNQLNEGWYVYLGYINTVFNIATSYEVIKGNGQSVTSGAEQIQYSVFSMNEFTPLLNNLDKIYSNGGSEILLAPSP